MINIESDKFCKLLEENVFTTAQTAGILKVSNQQIRNLVKKGKLPYCFISSKKYFFLAKEVYRYAVENPYVGNHSWNEVLREVTEDMAMEKEKAFPFSSKEVAEYVETHYISISDASNLKGVAPIIINYHIANNRLTIHFTIGVTSFLSLEEINKRTDIFNKKSQYQQGWEDCEKYYNSKNNK